MLWRSGRAFLDQLSPPSDRNTRTNYTEYRYKHHRNGHQADGNCAAKGQSKWLAQSTYLDPIGNTLGSQTYEQWTSHLQFLNRFKKLTVLLHGRHHGASKCSFQPFSSLNSELRTDLGDDGMRPQLASTHSTYDKQN